MKGENLLPSFRERLMREEKSPRTVEQYLRAAGRAGQAELTVSAAGMEPVTLNFTIQKVGDCDATQVTADC